MNENSSQTDDEFRAGPASGSESPAPNGHDAAAALVEAQRQRDEFRDQLQRAHAEFVNYQKRAKAQATAERAYAIVPLALDLIAVLDNFERAAEAARSAGVPSIVEGLEMVGKQLAAALSKHGIETIQSLGQPFDPTVHEAISQQVSSEHPEGTVIAELGKGYRMLDRVLRPAQVAVSIRPPADQSKHEKWENA
jgi:molecular chaperone GrpE